MRFATVPMAVVLLTTVTGCGCGDTVAMRQLRLTENRGVSSGSWGPFEIDTSHLPADAINERVETKDGCGNPITELRIFPNRPIKIVLMPATQP